MKIWIKIAIGVVCGFAGGFASGFFVHKKMNDVKFEEVSEEEMNEIEQMAQKDIQGMKEVANDLHAVNVKTEEAIDNAKNTDELRNAMQGKTPYIRADHDQKRAYEKMWQTTKEYSSEDNANGIPVPIVPEEEEDDHPGEEDFDEDFLEQIEEEAAEAGNDFTEPPHLITLGEFYNERPEYDKVTIDWYQPDNTWTDERQEIIADIRDYIGMEPDGLFEQNTGDDDPDVRFVRNEKYGSDYEIIRHHRSWAATVGGI